MLYKRVTCPETVHPELIEYDDDPLGTLIIGCSRFAPTCALRCSRTCAARLDRLTRCEPATYDTLDVGDDTNLGLDLAELYLRLERGVHST